MNNFPFALTPIPLDRTTLGHQSLHTMKTMLPLAALLLAGIITVWGQAAPPPVPSKTNDHKKINLRPPGGQPASKKNLQSEIERVQKRIAEIEDLMKRARFTKEGYEKISKELKELKALLKELESRKGNAPAASCEPVG